MTTTIISNGSKWAGEQPDSIETLLHVLTTNPLDRTFEAFGNFVIDDDAPMIRFFGNFFDLSHVFSIDTDEPDLIERLTAAIRTNQRRADYLSQDDYATVQAANAAYHAERDARRQADRECGARLVLGMEG